MKEFFLKHETDFLAAFFALNGATSALTVVAAIKGDIRYALASGTCLALAFAIWAYGHKLESERLSELEESHRSAPKH
jgi:hypothetical protein